MGRLDRLSSRHCSLDRASYVHCLTSDLHFHAGFMGFGGVFRARSLKEAEAQLLNRARAVAWECLTG